VATYRVSAVCNACGDLHPMGTTVSLPGAPVKQSMAQAFPKKNPPDHLAGLRDIRVYCPKFGRHYAQKDDKKIILVPVG
jgi:hypothetical protein